MQYRYKDREGMDFIVGDAMKLDMFPAKTFDTVIDKGCLDCIFCSYNTIDNALLAYGEAYRVLKPGKGKYISLTYGTMETRMAHMKRYRWDVEITPVAYSHGISMFIATKFAESTKKGRLKAAFKWGGLMAKNTSKDKWKAQECKKHSTMTKHKDKVNQLALQGIKMLTEEEEAALELDPTKGFRIEDVEEELKRGNIQNYEQEKQIKEDHLKEAEQIIEGNIKDGDIDDSTDPTDLASIAKNAFTKTEDKAKAKLGGGMKETSAIWKLAKKTLDSGKGIVIDGQADSQLVGEEEFEEMQKL